MKRLSFLFFFGLIALFPVVHPSPYTLHIATLIFIWGFIATAWSYMGRFELISLGHGAFLGIGAYTAGLLFNHAGVSPWVGMILGALIAAGLAGIIGFACFRFGVIGDYFALLTLALGEITTLFLVAFRDHTGGSLGFTLNKVEPSLWALKFTNKVSFYYVSLAFLLGAWFLWMVIDRSKMQKGLRAVGEDEIAASTLGVRVVRYKLYIYMISASVTSMGGVLYAWYISYINPHTLSGVGPSLDIAFKSILGGMFNLLGPAIGSALIVILEEYVRVVYGAKFVGISQVAYGIALVLLIMFLPRGIYGSLSTLFKKNERSN